MWPSGPSQSPSHLRDQCKVRRSRRECWLLQLFRSWNTSDVGRCPKWSSPIIVSLSVHSRPVAPTRGVTGAASHVHLTMFSLLDENPNSQTNMRHSQRPASRYMEEASKEWYICALTALTDAAFTILSVCFALQVSIIPGTSETRFLLQLWEHYGW